MRGLEVNVKVKVPSKRVLQLLQVNSEPRHCESTVDEATNGMPGALVCLVRALVCLVRALVCLVLVLLSLP